ncbi:PREDICTED: G2/mitotic-specific cyclin S13-7-like [Lupinus angustifolius]|uniref:G2/mitotic-specific cyclin S13-7-like n=1 Tax=Lupinus angustifolius TaxID=3871 RepID=UPI00092F442A|nr:PREDICTED: G2/mitotic-specific cyclin S13-7-like [Lupinus angustifolius]XP_019434562.1 PREDICTED: G2/mitotic-specific cyclin S13-7-like [Lupinus angustifolius]
MASLLDSNVLAQPQQQQPKGENKQKNEGRNRRVLKDIGNLVVKQSDPIPNVPKRITRNLGAQLLPNAQATEKNKKPSTDVGNFVAATKVEQAKKPTEAEVIIISSDDEEEEKEKQTVKGGRKEIERVAVRGKNSKAFSSVLSARSKAACGLTHKPKDLVEDIDVADIANELEAVEYLDDIYMFYKLTEDDGRVHDYMPSQPDINMKMRSILVDWLIEVHRKFELMPETLYLTLNIIDRFLSMKAVPRRELQLVGISSMLIACKYEEIWAPEVNDFVYIADNAYVREHILIMEKTILSKLEWYLTVPTPYVFLIRYIKASTPSDKEIENMVFFLAELSLMDYSAMINYCPSLIAASAVYAARCTLGRSPYWTETLKHYTGYCEEQLRDCSKIMVNFHSAAPESKLRAVYKKFSNSERGAVALVNPAKNLLSSSPPPQS